MKFLQRIITKILLTWMVGTSLQAEIFYVTSQAEFVLAHNGAAMNDSIIWRSGTYSDIFMNIRKDHLLISVEDLGGTIFTGASRVDVSGDFITLQGFQFLEGNIGTRDVINTTGSYNVFTQLNIRDFTCYKYLRIREESQFVEITYCNFENRLNLDDQNILSILVDVSQPGYHKIQWCSFKNFDGTGNDLGIEPIRIGLSTQADRISRSLVEYCYFTQCNGDGEVISSKATQNVYRYNTFENNPLAELVLRHGSEAIVYGNFFLNGKGGVRVREGQNHYIYNNYFFQMADRPIILQNRDSDPLDSIHIAFNTIINCSEVNLGGEGNNKPKNVFFANNIFFSPDNSLFVDPTGTETWIGNMAFGDFGIPVPAKGVTLADPQLLENSAGFFGLAEMSPPVNAAQMGYLQLPQFEGIDSIDTEILFDLMREPRPFTISEKDLGCTEYPHTQPIQPLATEDNTGPSYNTSITSNLHLGTLIVQDLISVQPNPVAHQLNMDIYSSQKADLSIEIMDTMGRSMRSMTEPLILPGTLSLSEDIADWPAGSYSIHASSRDILLGSKRIQVVRFIKH